MDVPQSIEAVRASAGTGKTYLLTSRYLTQLVSGARAETILATTFTRKAAGEILGRVLLRLAEAAAAEDAASSLARDVGDPALGRSDFQGILLVLCRQIHRVAISTIDSYFHRLAASFSFELGLPSPLRLIEGSEPIGVQLRMEAIRNLLDSAPPASFVALLERLHPHQAKRSVVGTFDALVQKLYALYQQTEPAAWCRLEPPPLLPKKQVQKALTCFQLHRVAESRKSWSRLYDTLIALVEGENWDAWIDQTVVQNVRLGKCTYGRQDLPDPVVTAITRVSEQARAVLLGRLADRGAALFEMLSRLDRHYEALRKGRGALFFEDLPLALARGLDGTRSEQAEFRLDASIRHLLLDEFQDTSPQQWAILRPLAQRVADGSNGPGSLFCVGDTKQAIYGWRGGVAEIFERMGDDVPGLTWSTMQRSWRSGQAVLDVVNRVFAHLLANGALGEFTEVASAWSESYQAHSAAREGLAAYVCLEQGPVVAPEPAQDGEESAGLELAPDPLLLHVADRVAAIARTAPGARIGVLVRTNRQVRPLIVLLRKRGLTASGEGGGFITDDPAIAVALAGMSFADHPGDRVAELRLRHSPLGIQLGLEPSVALGTRSRDGMVPEAVLDASRRIRETILTQGYPAVIKTWAEVLAPACSRRSIQRLLQLITLAERFDPDSGLRPTDFVRYVEGAVMEEPSPAKLRVMTVHKSKGLEFDVVVLHELDKGFIRAQTDYLVDQPDPTGPILAVYDGARKSLRALAPSLEAAYLQYRNRQVKEGLAGLYVGMTRARYALHMIVAAPKFNKNGAPRKTGLSSAAILREALADPLEIPSDAGAILFEQGDRAWMAHYPELRAPMASPEHEGTTNGSAEGGVGSAPVKPVRIAWAPTRPELERHWRRESPSALEADGIVEAGTLFNLERAEDLTRGNLLHAWFEQVTWLEEGLPERAVLEGISRKMAPELSAASFEDLLGEFEEMAARPATRILLSRPVLGGDERLELWRERRFMVRQQRRLLVGAFDRVVLVGGPVGWQRADVIDFKTGPEGGTGLTRQARAFAPQLKAYRKALSQMLGLSPQNIRCLLNFVGPGVVIEV